MIFFSTLEKSASFFYTNFLPPGNCFLCNLCSPFSAKQLQEETHHFRFVPCSLSELLGACRLAQLGISLPTGMFTYDETSQPDSPQMEPSRAYEKDTWPEESTLFMRGVGQELRVFISLVTPLPPGLRDMGPQQKWASRSPKMFFQVHQPFAKHQNLCIINFSMVTNPQTSQPALTGSLCYYAPWSSPN